MLLTHNGVEWNGTFDQTLGFMLDNILVDGPIEVKVTYMVNGDADREETDTGMLTAIHPTHLEFEDRVIERDAILAVEV